MTEKEIDIIRNLVGEFTNLQITNLEENLEYYLNSNLSLFVPIYKNCDFAITPNHSHPSYSFIYSIKSSGYFLLNGEKVFSPTNSSSFICAFSPSIMHQEVIEKCFSNYIAIFIDKAYFEEELSSYTNESINLEGLFLPANETLLFLLRLLMLEHSKNNDTSHKTIEPLNTLIANILIKSILNINTESLSINSQSIIDNSILYMYDNIDRKLTVEEIASHVNTSSSHYAKIFRESMSKSPIEYLNLIRIEKAKRLLKNNDKNLTDIAFDCGFSSSSYFSHCFFESVKLTPSEYRKRFSS